MEDEQRAVCDRYGAKFIHPDGALKVGISKTALEGLIPLHGLRHPPDTGTTGWFIWGGEYSDARDFFVSMCLHHLTEECPAAVPYLALAPGWRFLVAPDYEDVWYDGSLLEV